MKGLTYALQLADSAGLKLKSAKVVMGRFKVTENLDLLIATFLQFSK